MNKILLLSVIIFMFGCSLIAPKNMPVIQPAEYCRINPSTGCCLDEILDCRQNSKECVCVDRHQIMIIN